MNKAERREFLSQIIEKVEIYEEEQENGQWLKSIELKLPIIEHDIEISLDNDLHVETITLLSKPDSKRHISVELPIDEKDLTSAESKATYKQIQNYVLEKFGFKVSTLYIASEEKAWFRCQGHYNISKNENQKVPQYSIEKEEAILDALKCFKMIKDGFQCIWEGRYGF